MTPAGGPHRRADRKLPPGLCWLGPCSLRSRCATGVKRLWGFHEKTVPGTW